MLSNDADEESKGGYYVATQDVISEERESNISDDAQTPRLAMRDQSDQSGGRDNRDIYEEGSFRKNSQNNQDGQQA